MALESSLILSPPPSYRDSHLREIGSLKVKETIQYLRDVYPQMRGCKQVLRFIQKRLQQRLMTKGKKQRTI